jgi:hypothetical protein
LQVGKGLGRAHPIKILEHLIQCGSKTHRPFGHKT